MWSKIKDGERIRTRTLEAEKKRGENKNDKSDGNEDVGARAVEPTSRVRVVALIYKRQPNGPKNHRHGQQEVH